MKTRSLASILAAFVLLIATGLQAQQSSITEAEGESCMGDDKSRKQTEDAALATAKRLAIEFAGTHVQSETTIENFELQSDLVKAFANADVKVLDIIDKQWQNPVDGDCYTIRIKAEIIPPRSEIARISEAAALIDDPTAPLTVKVWTSKPTYKAGDAMKVFMRANKPFYARVIYVDAEGNNIQILPNRFRGENYFEGGVTYQVPSGRDKFDLSVGPPFGTETLTVYGSTEVLGSIETTELDNGMLLSPASTPVVAAGTRGITIIKEATDEASIKARQAVAEFVEESVQVTTGS